MSNATGELEEFDPRVLAAVSKDYLFRPVGRWVEGKNDFEVLIKFFQHRHGVGKEFRDVLFLPKDGDNHRKKDGSWLSHGLEKGASLTGRSLGKGHGKTMRNDTEDKQKRQTTDEHRWEKSSDQELQATAKYTKRILCSLRFEQGAQGGGVGNPTSTAELKGEASDGG